MKSADPRFAYDSYRRFIQIFADVVMGVDRAWVEQILAHQKHVRGVSEDNHLTPEDWKRVIESYKSVILHHTVTRFPQYPNTQLSDAITAVFRSWTNARAITYRKLHDIPQDWGTAVSVQAMVLGNAGDDCATGVAFLCDQPRH